MHPKGDSLASEAAVKTMSTSSFLHSLSTNFKTLYHGKDPATFSEVKDRHDRTCGTRKDMPPPPPPSSPALTAVEDFTAEDVIPSRHRRTTRSCLAALLMIAIGTSLALTFILIGIGKALSSNSNSSSSTNTLTPSEDLNRSSSSAVAATLSGSISTGIPSTFSGRSRSSTRVTSSDAIRSGISSTRSPTVGTSITTSRTVPTNVVEDWIQQNQKRYQRRGDVY